MHVFITFANFKQRSKSNTTNKFRGSTFLLDGVPLQSLPISLVSKTDFYHIKDTCSEIISISYHVYLVRGLAKKLNRYGSRSTAFNDGQRAGEIMYELSHKVDSHYQHYS